MPQITAYSGFIALGLGAALALSGCGDRDSDAVYVYESGKHIANWLPAGHAAASRRNLDSCVDCHGENLDGEGGISKVPCAKCHPGGTGNVHPLGWGQYAYARHDEFVIAARSPADPDGVVGCAIASCHGTALEGASGPGCATACHIGGPFAAHPQDWRVADGATLLFPQRHGDYLTAGGDYDSCGNTRCHGTAFTGVFLSGPSCYDCHAADPTDPAPLPDKHPRRFQAVWIADPTSAGFHGTYANVTLGGNLSSCITSLCHTPGATGPSCSTPTFNGRSCHQ